MKKALICGISGQDGSLLANFLLEKGYKVIGSSRDALVSTFSNLHQLGIFKRVKLESMALIDFRNVLQVLTSNQPDEIYNLAGQSSVRLSFQQPVETLESISTGTLNLLEAIRFTGLKTRLYNACSSECFGETTKEGADETTPFHPRSPYAVAKAAAYWEVANYREAYGIQACSGILFNHESILRPKHFVTRKIVSTAIRISQGEKIKLELGNLNIWRDWGYAPEYVDAMWRMLQQDQPDDYVVATGETHSLEEFVQVVFEKFLLDWKDHVIIEKNLYRPTDLKFSCGNPQKAKEKLGWHAHINFEKLIKILIDDEFEQQNFI